MKILLTGASGFLGKYLKLHFKDRHTTKTLGRAVACDFNFDLTKKVPIIDEEFDVVIHNAGKAHLVPKTDEEESIFFKVNYEGTVYLLNALEKYPPDSFIFISSVSVYGIEEGENINEDYPLNAKDPYGKSKILAEKAVWDWCAKHKVHCSIIRLPLVVGAEAPGNLGAMIKSIKAGYYFNVSKGEAKKSMVIVGDIPFAVEQAIGKSGVFNLTDGYHPSVKELSNLIAIQLKRRVYNLPYSIAYLVAKLGDLVGRSAPLNTNKLKKITTSLTFDDSKAKHELKWKPNKVLDGFSLHFIIDGRKII